TLAPQGFLKNSSFVVVSQSNIIRTFSSLGMGSGLLFIWTMSAHRKAASIDWMGAASCLFYVLFLLLFF
ncbi:MAG: hypothetical protein OSJ58_08745, partial [Dysosmobacter sp.]|nr:hypothetical protein [Dysosmobacter sp.]